ncbi:hypothetical protein EYC59_03805 [Candidatus Saccharibacteria bacterium]|nr:MAG: hypothetical protein EYC59_03805 [Candidatus Saccharibacteria bacterium]
MKRGMLRKWAVGAGLFFGVVAAGLSGAAAQGTAPQGDFSLQVTPSPLVATVKPGEVSKLDLKIRNAGTTTEELKIEPRAFRFDDNSGNVSLNDTTPPDIASWISFSNPTFTVQPGQWFTQQITVSLPKDSGFSYSFALVISRKNAPKPVEGSRLLKGSLAVFTLINVDRPGATSKLQVVSLTTDKRVYEFLPATVKITFKNTGNTIVQPYGNIFIQRSKNSKTPIDTLPVNDNKSYILPGTQRSTTATWSNGFPVYEVTTNPDGTTSKQLQFNWDTASRFRIGRYTAKMVAVYSDGQRDIPIEGEVSFWVIPWRTILIALAAIAALWAFARWRSKRRTDKAVQRALLAAKKADEEKAKADSEKEKPRA